MGNRLATIDISRKLVGGAVPLFLGGDWAPIYHNVAGAEVYLHDKFHLDPSNRLATVHQRHRQTDRTGQRSDSTGRTVLQTVAQQHTLFLTVMLPCCDGEIKLYILGSHGPRPLRSPWAKPLVLIRGKVSAKQRSGMEPLEVEQF